MQNITITCAVLILIAFVSFYSQEIIQRHQKIVRDPVSEEVSAFPATSLRSGSLFEQKLKKEIVRFSLYRSFEDAIWITLDLNEGKMLIESRGFDMGAQQGKKLDLAVKVDSQYVKAVRTEIVESYLEAKKEEGEVGLDGSTWVIELTWNGKYYASDVWSPEFGPEHQLGSLLFDRAQQYASLGPLY
ncbi:hypothetical protein [Microbulbifer rhizosphaerae]|uniref:Uncharacterized protein n=1 Tax=Microbulbifer rhizosphaerae TaxID=1562603 RepID=A0A7W4WGF5_9GAMM|nr:hypothetical protein [Microbulbifer rhizosphaerae]MBB3063735.1 hypothetical protein [Microbulbifer rhizosphaerae]